MNQNASWYQSPTARTDTSAQHLTDTTMFLLEANTSEKPSKVRMPIILEKAQLT